MDKEWNWEALLEAEPPARRSDTLEEAVESVLVIQQRDTIDVGKGSARRWRGALRIPAEEASTALTERFRREGLTAFIHGESDGDVTVVAAPALPRAGTSRLWVALLLFGLTVISTVVTGAASSGPNDELVWNWTDGAMYSGTLLAILLAHELGHFVASRRLGVAVSYPFFIPMPLIGIFGTMGAFIQMKEAPPDRRALFTIAVAGPLAGLVLAVPLTLLGLALSTVEPLPTSGAYVLEGNNLLYGAMKWLVFGEWLPGNGRDVMLHPIAWAGWAGMLVTALNLLPAGQLDGGHVVFALLGRRLARYVTGAVIGVLLALGFMWEGWWVWALMIMFLANRYAPLLNDVTSLTPRQRVLALLTILLFVLLFTPMPLVFVEG